MNIRLFLGVIAIPFVIGTFGFVAQANAAAPGDRHPQIVQQQRPNEKPQIKRQPRPQQKKPHPQIDHRTERHQVRPNNR